jgi:hypothetical protein
MQLCNEVWMLKHDFRGVRPGLEVAASLELKEVPLGTDDRTSFEPIQESKSGRGRSIVHVRSPSFPSAPDLPEPVQKVID